MFLLSMDLSSFWPSGLNWKRSTAEMSSNRNGKSNNCTVLVYCSNLASDGAIICTSPNSKASISLPSPNSEELG
ncbi:hypothetical protein D3C75_1307210 [compost metagenome]